LRDRRCRGAVGPKWQVESRIPNGHAWARIRPKTGERSMATLRIPTPLRAYTGGNVEVQVEGRNVAEVMRALVDEYPALRPHLYSGDGELRPFVNLFVGEHNIKDLQGLDTALEPEARVLLIPSIAGG
jgi:molybdopterin synthase sulfur carrier subunit